MKVSCFAVRLQKHNDLRPASLSKRKLSDGLAVASIARRARGRARLCLTAERECRTYQSTIRRRYESIIPSTFVKILGMTAGLPESPGRCRGQGALEVPNRHSVRLAIIIFDWTIRHLLNGIGRDEFYTIDVGVSRLGEVF